VLRESIAGECILIIATSTLSPTPTSPPPPEPITAVPVRVPSISGASVRSG
ncbi:hypothetical protein BGX34_002395, partial [Mortierella sp. NVP85]